MLPSRKSWSFTILFHWDVAKSWSQRQKVGVKYSKSGDNENSAFQGKFHFQGLFKTDLHFQVLFKPVQTLQKTGEAEDGTSLVYCKASILTITPWLLLWKVVALIKAMDDPEFIDNLVNLWRDKSFTKWRLSISSDNKFWSSQTKNRPKIPPFSIESRILGGPIHAISHRILRPFHNTFYEEINVNHILLLSQASYT